MQISGRVRLLAFALLTVLLGSTIAAAEERDRYEVSGKVVPPLAATVALHGTAIPFQVVTRTGPDGKFRFKKVPPEVYDLVVYHWQYEDFRTSLHVGPKTADQRGKIQVVVKMQTTRSASEKRTVVGVKDLSIPDEAHQEYAKAQNCLAKNDTACAVTYMEKTVKIAPQYSAAWNHLGVIAHQSQRYQDSVHFFQKALEADPEAYLPLVNMGGSLINLHRLEEALKINTQAVSRQPQDPLANSQLGLTYFGLRQLELAEKYLLVAEQLDAPPFTQPQMWLAEIYMRRGDKKRAAQKVEDLLKYHPNLPDADKFKQVLARLTQSTKP